MSRTRSALIVSLALLATILPLSRPDVAGASPTCDGLTVTIEGTGGDDDIVGTPEADVIDGGEGDDTISGLDGDDTICGGNGDDLILGDVGNDRLLGGNGDDEILGNDGDDTIDGGNGTDTIDGGDGDDTVTGYNGDDTIDGGPGNDDLDGENGTDTVRGESGNDTLGGGNGGDDLDGGLDVDVVDGGNGPDVCANAEIAISCETDSSFNPPADDGPGVCQGQVPSIVGTDGDDVLNGTNGDDVILALGGNDTIDGGNGDDLICGGDGNDTIDGGNGQDDIRAGPGDDVVTGHNNDDVIDGGPGNDDLDGFNGDDIVLGGEGDDTIRGSNGSDTLNADGGNDLVEGGNGKDVLSGDAGTDTLDGGNSFDRCFTGETLIQCEDDGTADGDGDGIVDFLEDKWGTSNNKVDTDGDGLTDYFEISVGGHAHWPLDADSDDDGTGDADEDYDEDGLIALDEQTYGTDPFFDDTDGDRALDGAEVIAGTDPLVPDQPQQTVKVTSADITVALTGAGDLSGSLTIETNDDPFFNVAPGQISPIRNIDLDEYGQANLTEAIVTFSYDGSTLPADESDLVILTWDDELLLWVPAGSLDTQVTDANADTITATVEHFSPFGLFDIAEWLAFWATPIDCSGTGGGTGDNGAVDVALVLDSSGSMGWNDPSGLRKTAAKSFVDLLRVDNTDPADNDRAMAIDFDSNAFVLEDLTDDIAALKTAIDRVDSSGGTNLSSGVSLALSRLDAQQRVDTAQVVVLLTDGVGSYSSFYTSLAAGRGVIIFTVGLGSSVDATLLQAIADGTGGQYFPAASASDLEDVFLEIGGEVTSEDQDGDGLTNCEELEGMRGGNGTTYFSDPTIADTDGDLLPDGIEVGEKQPGASYDPIPFVEYYPVASDPEDDNSDDDDEYNTPATAPDDAFEWTAGSNAFILDSDYENNGAGKSFLDDGLEFLVGLDATHRDTDRDGFSDYYEFFGLGDEDPEKAIALGLDPLIPDETDDFGEFTRQYIDGFTCGDAYNLCPWVDDDDVATLPYLFGAVASGFGGPIPDSRDLIGNITRGDFLGTGLSLIAFIPILGDSAAGASRVIRTLNAASPAQAAAVLKRVDEIAIPGGIKDDIIDGVIGGSVRTLKNSGLTDEAVTIFRTNGVNLKAVANAVENASPSAIPSPGFLDNWRQGEAILRNSGPDFIDKGKGFADPISGGRRNYRIADAWDPANGVMLESKTGAQRLSDKIRRQIDRDAALLANDDAINKVEWHFFASDISGRIADDPELFDYLTQKGIPYVVHLP